MTSNEHSLEGLAEWLRDQFGTAETPTGQLARWADAVEALASRLAAPASIPEEGDSK